MMWGTTPTCSTCGAQLDYEGSACMRCYERQNPLLDNPLEDSGPDLCPLCELPLLVGQPTTVLLLDLDPASAEHGPDPDVQECTVHVRCARDTMDARARARAARPTADRDATYEDWPAGTSAATKRAYTADLYREMRGEAPRRDWRF